MKKLLKIFTLFLSIMFVFNSAAIAGKKAKLDADKVLVVMFYDNHCANKWCPPVKTTLKAVKEKYGDKIAVHMINMSELDEAKIKSKKLGVYACMGDVLDLIPVVVIFSKKRKLIREISGVKNEKAYCKFIDKALKRG